MQVLLQRLDLLLFGLEASLHLQGPMRQDLLLLLQILDLELLLEQLGFFHVQVVSGFFLVLVQSFDLLIKFFALLS